jgi:membrane peptidoglycan carboxypeptidase
MADQPARPPNSSNPTDLWHAPDHTSVEPTPKPVTTWRVPALPSNMTTQPAAPGNWHLPTLERTRYKPGEQITITEQPRALPDAIRPEDMVAQLMAAMPATSTTAPAPEDLFLSPAQETAAPPPEDAMRPEDFDFPPATAVAAAQAMMPAPEDRTAAPIAPEDFELPTSTLGDTPILRPGELTDTNALNVLAALDDEDEAFSISELQALASMTDGTADLSGIHPDDMTPAQKALFNAANAATEVMPSSDEAATGALTTAADPNDPQAVARENLAKLLQGDAATLDMPSATSAGTVAGNVSDPGAVARAELEKLLSGTQAGQATQSLSPAQTALAGQFNETRQKVNFLRAQYQNGQIGYDDLQNQLKSLSILDDKQQWWAIGLESDKWYRHDPASNQWVEDTPPVPVSDPRLTEASNLNPAEVLAGSLPYIPDNQQPITTGGEFSDPYLTNQVTIQGSSAYPGVPRPGEPRYDTGATIVGQAYDQEYLQSGAPTIQAMPSVYDPTVPMSTVTDDAVIGTPYDASVPPDYDLENGYAPQFDEYKDREQRSLLRVAGFLIAGVLVCGIVTAIGGFVGVMAWYNSAIAPYEAAIDGLADYNPPFQTVRILDARGGLIAEINSQSGGAREVVTLDEVSPFLLHAIISAENETYYDDPGFSIPAILRAFLQNVSSGDIESGASTITQQIARNLILGGDTTPTAERKVNEVLIANRIAEKYDKNFILQLYVNQFFFGNQSYGVEAASQFYFDKPAAEVNMAEAAMLASLIQAPSANDPVVNRDQSKIAMRNIIRRMLEVDCIQFQHGTWAESGEPFCINEDTRIDVSGQQAALVRVNANGTYGGALALQLAQVETRPYLPRASRYKYPHFVNFIQTLVETEFGTDAMFQRGFTIYTTLEPRVQDAAQNTLTNTVASLVNNGVNTGAVMAVDPKTGAIRAMVGSPDFNDEDIGGQVDNTRTYQQPGSSIKPLMYAAALEGANGQYLTPASIIWDVPSSYPVAGGQAYTPVNFSRRFYGPVSVRKALQGSLNVSAVKVFEFVGAERFAEITRRLGINYVENSTFGLPSALGANDVRLIDMMKAYSTFANNGTYQPLYAIDRITEDAGGATLEVPLPETMHPPAQQKISPQVAYLLQNILSDDAARAAEFGANSAMTLANIGIPTQNYVAAKSGTSNDNRDLWTLGFTSNAVVGVWLGTFDNQPTVGTTSLAASQVWNNTMQAFISGRAPQPFANPGGVVQGTICADTGTIAADNCATRTTEIFIQTLPPPPPEQGFVQQIAIDSWTNQRANDLCPENQVIEVFANIADPFAVQWLNGTAEGRAFKQRVGLPDNLLAAPQTACTQGMILPTVRLNNPSPNQTLTGLVTLRGQISASDFNRYDLLYASGANPTSFQSITTATQQFPNQDSPLGTWDTTNLPNGGYIVRLAAYSNQGGYVFRDVNVLLNNVPPTPTPAPPTPTLPPQITPVGPQFTPLPFDPNSGGGGPTPTIGGI